MAFLVRARAGSPSRNLPGPSMPRKGKHKVNWEVAGNPRQTSSLCAGIRDSVFWPKGMPENSIDNMCFILAQVLHPVREHLGFLQTQLNNGIRDNGPSAGTADSGGGSGSGGSGNGGGTAAGTADGAPPLPQSASSMPAADHVAGSSEFDPSLSFQLQQADMQEHPANGREYHSTSADAAVKAAVARIEACALGVLESLGSVTHSSFKHVPPDVRGLPSMSVPSPGGIYTGTAQGASGFATGSPSAAGEHPSGQQCYRMGPGTAVGLSEPPPPEPGPALPTDGLAQRVSQAQRSVSRVRSTSPCPNIPVILPDGRQEFKSWVTIESMMAQGLIDHVKGVGWVSKV